MFRIGLGKICALGPSTQNQRIIRLVQEPKNHTLRAQEATDRAQHLPEELVWCRRSGENIQAVAQCFDLAAGDLLGSTQSLLSTITFDGNPYEVRRYLDQLEVVQGGRSRF